MNHPFFSIIVPTYNRGYRIANALNSVFKQSFSSWEVIVIDDASSDDTEKVVRTLSKENEKVFYFKQYRNEGPANARNLGINLARGEFLAFLDSDDHFLPDHLEKRYQIIQKNQDLDFIYGGMKIVGSALIPDRYDLSKTVDISTLKIFPTGTYIVRTEAAKEIGGFPNLRLSEDMEFLAKAKRLGYKTRETSVPTYVYTRDCQDSITNQILKNHALVD